MTETIDHVLARIAAPQCGAFRVEQAFHEGVTASAIYTRLRRGSLDRRHPRTYVFAQAASIAETEVWAAILAGGDTALLTGDSAAFEWGLTRSTTPPPPTLLVSHRHRPLTGVRLIESRTLGRDDRAERNGRPVASVARMLVDYSDDLSIARLCWYLREADFHHLLDVERVRDTMQRNAGRRGSARMRTALDRYLNGDNGADNAAEDRFVQMLHRAGVDDAVANKVLHLSGEIVRPDVWIEHASLAVELDERSHSLAAVMREDRLKEALFRAHGIPIIRIDQSRLGDGVRTVVEVLSAMAARTLSPIIDDGVRTFDVDPLALVPRRAV